jgi:hypothetical protein
MKIINKTGLLDSQLNGIKHYPVLFDVECDGLVSESSIIGYCVPNNSKFHKVFLEVYLDNNITIYYFSSLTVVGKWCKLGDFKFLASDLKLLLEFGNGLLEFLQNDLEKLEEKIQTSKRNYMIAYKLYNDLTNPNLKPIVEELAQLVNLRERIKNSKFN